MQQQQPSNGPPIAGGSPSSIGDPAVFGVVTVSDRASSGVYEDLSGPAILQFFQEAIHSPWTAKYVVIPDEQPIIEATLKDLVSREHTTPSGHSPNSTKLGLSHMLTLLITHLPAWFCLLYFGVSLSTRSHTP